MCALKIQDQGTITLSQMDYLPIVIESFLVDRKSQGLSGETVQFHKKKLNYFAKFCKSQVVTQIGQLTPDLLRRYLLELGEQHNPGEVHACFRTLRTLLLWIGQEEIMPMEWKNTYTHAFRPAFALVMLRNLVLWFAPCNQARDRN